MLPAELSDVGLYESMSRYGDLCIHAVIDLRRAFSREELERAVTATIADFPVLGRAYEARFWRDRWRPVDGPVSDVVHVVDDPADLEAETDTWVRRPIAFTRERPLRVVSLRRRGGSRVILTVMHLAVDGGGLAAVGHVLASHLYRVRPSAPADARRDIRGSLDRLRWYHLPLLVRDVARSLVQPLRTYGAARRERPYPASGSREAAWRHLVIGSVDLADVKARCRARRASVNDALIAALARVAAGRSTGGPVAVLYTMDLRRYARAPRLTAANTSSILTAVVPRAAVGDLAETAGAVAAITARHRRGLDGPAFLAIPLALGAAAPHALARRFTRWMFPLLIDVPLRRGFLVTNVGKLDGGLAVFGSDVEALRVIGPNIDGVRVPVVVAYGLRGELHLELYAPRGLAARALEDLEGELRSALELPPRGRSLPAAAGKLRHDA
jgi:NRPS condensation-like uncharacterized protein